MNSFEPHQYKIGILGGGQLGRMLLQKAIDLDPKSADAHFNLALVYYQSGSYKNAESEALLAKKFGRGTEADNLLLLLRKKKS